MDVTLAEIFGIVLGIFLLLLSTVLLIGYDRLRGIFLLSTPDLRVYDPMTNRIVNPSIPGAVTTTPPTGPNRIPPTTVPASPTVPRTSTTPTATMPPTTIPPTNPTTNPTTTGYLQPNQYAQPPNYPTYQGQGPYVLTK